jgi:hypothetical protein
LTFFVVPILYTLLIKEGPEYELDIEAELADEPDPVLAPETATVPPAETLPRHPLTVQRQ